jgi:hypothetical protein
MKVWRNPAAASALLARIRSERPDRSGLHLSGLISCARRTFWQLRHPEDFGDGGPYAEDDGFTLVVALGKGFHNMLEDGEETTYEQDGVLFTPDDLEDDLVVEIKETRKSSRQSPADGQLYNYVEQAAGYCVYLSKQLGRPITKARLAVVHICGDWKGSPMPVLHVWDLEFEDWELEAWGKELDRRKKLILRAKTIDDIPLYEHYAGGKTDRNWECNYCPLKDHICPGGGGERLPFFPHVIDMGETRGN